MSSKTEIANMALRDIGISRTVTDVDLDRTAEAQAIRDYYNITLKTVLRAFPWPFALRRQTLAQLSANPLTEWGFGYRVPPEALRVWRLPSGYRPDTRKTILPYEIESDANGEIIYSSESPANVLITVLVTNTELYPADFVTALHYRLAADVAPSVTAGDPYKLGPAVAQKYMYQLTQAKIAASTESQSNLPSESELFTSRGGR